MIRLGWRLAALRTGILDAAAYRWEFFFEILTSAFVPAAIQWILWYAIFKVGGATEVAGMGYAQLVQYTLTSVLFTQVRGGDHDFVLAEMIRSGTLSNYLLRPMGVVEFIYLEGVAPKLITSAFCLALGCTVGAWFGLSPLHVVLGMLLAFVGNVIHYQISASLASAAFYWEEAYSVLMVKNLLVSFLSGELIPLNLFPAQYEWIWRSTPFYLYVFGPTQIALGRWGASEILMQFAIAGGWLVAGALLIRMSWGIGIRRYLSLGG